MTDTTVTTTTETTQTPTTGTLDAALAGVPKTGFAATTETTETKPEITADDPAKDGPKLYAGKFKSVEDMEKGYLEADKLISKGVERVPEAYETAALEQANLGFRDDQHRDTTLTALKTAGMSQKTLNAVAPLLAEAFSQRDAEKEKEFELRSTERDQIILTEIQSRFGVVPDNDFVEKQIASLKSEWGDDFDAKSKVANAYMADLPERIRVVAHWDAEVFKFVYGLAVEKRGPELVKGEAQTGGESLDAELQAVIKNPDYYKANAAGAELQRKAADLSAKIAGQRK